MDLFAALTASPSQTAQITSPSVTITAQREDDDSYTFTVALKDTPPLLPRTESVEVHGDGDAERAAAIQRMIQRGTSGVLRGSELDWTPVGAPAADAAPAPAAPAKRSAKTTAPPAPAVAVEPAADAAPAEPVEPTPIGVAETGAAVEH